MHLTNHKRGKSQEGGVLDWDKIKAVLALKGLTPLVFFYVNQGFCKRTTNFLEAISMFMMRESLTNFSILYSIVLPVF